jgi:hypothetical protein
MRPAARPTLATTMAVALKATTKREECGMDFGDPVKHQSYQLHRRSQTVRRSQAR